MVDRFYVTTPIYYVNARPHLGHAYTTIAADVANRFHAMQQKELLFLTGTDEHGDKVVQAAENENLDVRDYVDMISGLFRNMWPKLNIKHSHFIRTTDKSHIAVVEKILASIYEQGDIYFSEYEGLYCFGCERFYMERERIPEEKFHVIYNGIDLTPYEKAPAKDVRSELNIPGESFLMGMVGRLVPQKGQKYLGHLYLTTGMN